MEYTCNTKTIESEEIILCVQKCVAIESEASQLLPLLGLQLLIQWYSNDHGVNTYTINANHCSAPYPYSGSCNQRENEVQKLLPLLIVSYIVHPTYYH